MEFNPLNPSTSGYVIAGEVLLGAVVVTAPISYNQAKMAGKSTTFAIANAAGLGIPLLVAGADKAMDEKIKTAVDARAVAINGFSVDEFNNLKKKVDEMPQSVVEAIRKEKNFFQMDQKPA